MSSTTQALFTESPQQGEEIIAQMGKQTGVESGQASPTAFDARELERIFLVQKQAFECETFPEYHTRKARLETLYVLIDDHSEELAAALNKDFGCRAREESEIAEIIGSLSTIRYQIKNLKKYMRPQKRKISIWFLPAKGEVVLRPLGVVGVMAPWNYTLHLTIAPVAAALASGNRVMAKMSELTPHTTRLLKKLVSNRFSTDVLSIIEGGVEVAQAFSSLPFNHLLFTGSTHVGIEIAKSAAQNLTPVTLELSGKSPVVVGKYYDVAEAAKRIVWGKCFNAGQTCVAPDYVYVPRQKLLEFVRAARAAANEYYPDGIEHKSYTSVINQGHCQRINKLIEDARDKGAEVLPLIESQASDAIHPNKMPPTLVLQPDQECLISQEEIFGPVLPVYVYDELDEVINAVKLNPDPLALYIFSHHQAEIDYLAKRIPAGNVAINDTLLEYTQNDLPFGGVGKSGLGKYHGKEGFEAFSNKQATFTQVGLGGFTGTKLLYPPYGRIGHTMLRLLRLMP